MPKIITHIALQEAVLYVKHKFNIKRDIEIATAIGYTKGTFSSYLNGKSEISSDFIAAFEDFYKLSLEEFGRNKINNSLENVESTTHLNERGEINADLILPNERVILELINSNKLLVEAHLLLAKSNNELVAMQKATVDAAPNINLAFESKFSDLLELIAEIGSGKKWLSKQEAAAELSKRFHGKKGGK